MTLVDKCIDFVKYKINLGSTIWSDLIPVVDGIHKGSQVLVTIESESAISCEQARISLAAYCENDYSDWKNWESTGKKDFPFRLTLVNPGLVTRG